MSAGSRANRTGQIDVAIVGAGPYGLSLSAHLTASRIEHRIFGEALSTWAKNMPVGMLLKSEGFASSLSSPAEGATLGDYCRQQGEPYRDTTLSVPLDRFLRYGNWFKERHVPQLEEKLVVSLRKEGEKFRLLLSTNEEVTASRVVLATGLTSFKYCPPEFDDLPDELVSHSADHRSFSSLAGREVIVIGGGASAIDAAVALHELGASVRVLARRDVRFLSPYKQERFWTRLRYPVSGIGPGWKSWVYCNAPWAFRRLPEEVRMQILTTHLGPAPGWFMKDRVEGVVQITTRAKISRARDQRGRIEITAYRSDTVETFRADHVILATGYRTDLTRLTFVDGALRDGIAQYRRHPTLFQGFRTSEPGLFVVGPAAGFSYGPMMRFIVGAQFAASQVSRSLAHGSRKQTSRRAQ